MNSARRGSTLSRLAARMTKRLELTRNEQRNPGKTRLLMTGRSKGVRMKHPFFWLMAVTAGLLMHATGVLGAASPNGSLVKAKQAAEAKGYVFHSTHDEIIAQAKKEGKLHVLTSTDRDVLRASADAFKKKYPFINLRCEEVGGTETYQRMLQEMRTGMAKWDVNYVAFDNYEDYIPYQKKYDLLGMTQQGVLKMIPDLIDPVNRHIVALGGHFQAVAYNKQLVSPERLPGTWDGFLNPEFKDRKIATDIRSVMFAALVPAWGLERTVAFARKLSAQNPIWLRGVSRIISSVQTGEVPIGIGLNGKSILREQKKDRRGVLGLKIVEPVPARMSGTEAVLATAENPHAALLWLEFQASLQGQKVLDEADLNASLLTPGSMQGEMIRGKKVSLLGWEHYREMGRYQEEVVNAFGFPRADKK
jgi:ABC-type Fe3+ transport system substrate-binding protein